MKAVDTAVGIKAVSAAVYANSSLRAIHLVARLKPYTVLINALG